MIIKSKHDEALFLFSRRYGLPHFLSTKHQELLRAFIIAQSQSICLDRGWSMKLSTILTFIVFGLALMGVVKANDQQMQQTPINAAIGVLAIRSRASQNCRSDLLLCFGSPPTREYDHTSRVSVSKLATKDTPRIKLNLLCSHGVSHDRAA